MDIEERYGIKNQVHKCISNNISLVDGYARVITDSDGKIIYEEDWYSSDDRLHNDLTDMNFNEWIEESKFKDSEVLIIYKYWDDKYWTDCGYEYDSGLDVVNEILLKPTYKTGLIKAINDLTTYIKDNSNAECKAGIVAELGFLKDKYEDIYDEEYIVGINKTIRKSSL